MMRSNRVKLALALLGVCVLSACYGGDVGADWGVSMGYPAPYVGYGGYGGYGGGYYGGYGGGVVIGVYGRP
jgi:hypothetical protein